MVGNFNELNFFFKLMLPCLGFTAKGGADAVGEPDHGHVGVVGLGHRAAHRVAAPAQALRT